MAYGIQSLSAASSAPRQDVRRLSQMGRGGDDTVAHLTSGEMVIPKSMQTPGIMSIMAGKMRERGINPAQYIVGSPFAQANANPYTGAQQFPEPGAGDDWGGPDGGGPTGSEGYDGGGDGFGPGGGYGYDPDEVDYHTDVREALARVDAYADNRDKELEARSWIEEFFQDIVGPKPMGAILGGAAGLLSPIPGGLMLGAKKGAELAQAMADRPVSVNDYMQATGQISPDSINQSNVSDFESSNLSDGFNRDGGRGGIGGIGDYGRTGQRYATTMPVDGGPIPVGSTDNSIPPVVDFENYGYGPEVLRYPWQTSDGVSYGQYPINWNQDANGIDRLSNRFNNNFNQPVQLRDGNAASAYERYMQILNRSTF